VFINRALTLFEAPLANTSKRRITISVRQQSGTHDKRRCSFPPGTAGFGKYLATFGDKSVPILRKSE